MTVVSEPLSISTGSLPAAFQQLPYYTTVSARGGVTPYAWSVSSGSLPGGMTLDSASGTIGGAPAASGSYSVEVQVRDNLGSTVKRTLSLLVSAVSAVAISTSALPAAASGMDYAASLAAAGGVAPYTWSLASGSLPPGLILGAVTGQISGVPSAEGTYDFTVGVTDGASQTAGKPLEVAVAAGAVSSGPPAPRPGDVIIFQDDFESGNLSKWDEAPARYAVKSDPSNSGQKAVQGLISSTQKSGELNKWFLPGYDDVYVRFDMRYEGAFLNGPEGSGLHLTSIMGNQLTNKWSASGKAGIRPNGTDFFLTNPLPETAAQTQNQSVLPMELYSQWPEMSCPSNYDLLASRNCYGNPIAQSSPKVDTNDGQWDTYVTRVKANTIGQRDGLQQMWIDGKKVIEQSNLRWRDTTNLKVNQFSIQLYMEEVPKAESVWFDNVTIWSPGGGQPVPAPASAQSIISITTSVLPDASIGAPYNASLTAAGGTALYTWVLSANNLPPGLSLSGAGQIMGSAMATGTYGFIVKAADALGQTITRSLTLTVASAVASAVSSTVPQVQGMFSEDFEDGKWSGYYTADPRIRPWWTAVPFRVAAWRENRCR